MIWTYRKISWRYFLSKMLLRIGKGYIFATVIQRVTLENDNLFKVQNKTVIRYGTRLQSSKPRFGGFYL